MLHIGTLRTELDVHRKHASIQIFIIFNLPIVKCLVPLKRISIGLLLTSWRASGAYARRKVALFAWWCILCLTGFLVLLREIVQVVCFGGLEGCVKVNFNFWEKISFLSSKLVSYFNAAVFYNIDLSFQLIFLACGGTVKGITFKDLLCSLVLLTRGSKEEKIKCELHTCYFICHILSKIKFIFLSLYY